MKIKFCSQCNTFKPFKNIQYKTCDACREKGRDYDHIYYETHREERLKSAKTYYSTNREKKLEYQREYYLANRKNVLKRIGKYRETNIKKVREKDRNRYVMNPAQFKAHVHNRRARIHNNGGTLPPNVEQILFEQQRGICYLCNKPLFARLDDIISIEHKTPISRGGANNIDNVRLAHLSCNLRKGAKTVEEFLNDE